MAFLAMMLLQASGQDFSVMFYNVENLFDTVDDTTKNDEEFLPGGSRRWTASRYHRKLSAVARAVAVGGGGGGPSLEGLCGGGKEEGRGELV
ncbi:MAG TPA: hypothetical protein PKE28_11045, partial [Bacteroidales bacterium]|nr:hypothetical protein [Bacteroidales bacterium]